MRWITPKLNDKRIRSGFLFLPKCINGETRWLEFAYWEEMYVETDKIDYVLEEWVALEWLGKKGV